MRSKDPKPSPRRTVFYGWVIIAAGTLLLSTSFGVSYSFGVFLKPLQMALGAGCLLKMEGGKANEEITRVT